MQTVAGWSSQLGDAADPEGDCTYLLSALASARICCAADYRRQALTDCAHALLATEQPALAAALRHAMCVPKGLGPHFETVLRQLAGLLTV